jgi:hypothetical protein
MIFHHHDLTVELDDAWWAEAQMEDFVPTGSAYRVDLHAAKGRTVFDVRLDEIGPVRRNPGVGIFNNNEEKTARERVVSILNGFRMRAAIPPIELVDALTGSRFHYKLVAGTHRLLLLARGRLFSRPGSRGF